MFWKVGPELCDIAGVIAALDWNEVRVHHKVEKLQPSSEGDGFSVDWSLALSRCWCEGSKGWRWGAGLGAK